MSNPQSHDSIRACFKFVAAKEDQTASVVVRTRIAGDIDEFFNAMGAMKFEGITASCVILQTSD